MINKKNEPILADSNISAADLDHAIRSAIRFTIGQEARDLGSLEGGGLKAGKRPPTFASFYENELSTNYIYGSAFIQAAYKVSQTSFIEKKKDLPELTDILVAKPTTIVSGVGLEAIRKGLRMVLFHLWCSQTILLPISFKIQRSIDKCIYKELLTEVAAYFWNYDPAKATKPQKHPTLGSWDDGGFNHKAPRVIFPTDWHRFEDVNIYDLGELHAFILNNKSEIPNICWPIRPMLKEMIHRFSERVTFTEDEVKSYWLWVQGRNFQAYSFEEFHRGFAEIEMGRQQQYMLKRTEAGRKKYVIRRRGLGAIIDVDLSKPIVPAILEKIAKRNDHDAALEYFTEIKGLDRGFTCFEPYPGREHVDVAVQIPIWHKTTKGFIEYRQKQGYEHTEEHEAVLRLLNDYLFCYLPWWIELHPQNNIKVPLSPDEFKRFVFLVGNNKSLEERPLPFLEICKLRRTTVNARAHVISTLYYYFEYLRGYKNLYPELVDKEIENPIVLVIDYPKGRKKADRTNKVPIPKGVVPYLILYLYAIEKFGVYLQDKALQGNRLVTFRSQRPVLRPEGYGYPLEIVYQGKTYPIHEIPNVFAIVKRTIRTPDGELLTVDIPHLTALRMLMATMETGLRVQSIQWLDRRKWDYLNTGKPKEQIIYDLYVNTDKSRPRPWVAPLIYRARYVLLREQRFQESIVEEGMDELVPYEQRSHSRFEDILPLFRSSGFKGLALDDSKYNEAWLKLLIGFERFYNEQISRKDYIRFVTFEPTYIKGIKKEGNELVEYDLDGNPHYCPLRYRSIHTPHALRATFISNRMGILDAEEIREAVGHTDLPTTYHYMVANREEIDRKLELADEEMWNYDPENPAHIRADKENSALRKSFEKNRLETEKRFGFVSVSLVNDKDPNIKEGVQLLRTTAASEVVFRETHICPVGEVCPSNVMHVIQEPRRCGLCPLAVKSVDHLPAIAAKMRQLLEQIQNAHSLLKRMEARGEPEATLNEVNERRKLDALEYIGWEHVHGLLSDWYANHRDERDKFHVDEPELVKLHLKLVSRKCGKVDFILERILDSVVYPSLETPDIRAKANTFRQQLLANTGRIEEALREIGPGDELAEFLSSMKVVTKVLGVTHQDIVDLGLLERRIEGSSVERRLLPPATGTLVESSAL